VIRIRDKSGIAVGAGVFLANNKVITCAHVITSALNLSVDADLSQIIAEKITLDFPLIGGDPYTATIETLNRKSDVACLRLDSSVPETAKAVLLIHSADFWNHPFRVYGFPRNYDIGVWASGALQARNEKGWIQLTANGGYRIQPGFSGSPVYDNVLDGVIGIIVASDTNGGSAFVIPSEIIVNTLPALKFNLREINPYQKDTSFPAPDEPDSRKLKAFLCHAAEDKPLIRGLYHKLRADGIDPWLDEEDLIGGQSWKLEISKAVKNSDCVIVCLSNDSVAKTGYLQKEIKEALDAADERPDGSIFLIPARLDECKVPDRLAEWHWVDLFGEHGYERLVRSLQKCAETAKIRLPYLRQSQTSQPKLSGNELRIATFRTLLSIPFGYGEQERRAFVYLSRVDDELISRISFTGPQASFVPSLVQVMESWGKLTDGRLAITALLETAREYAGDSETGQEINALIDRWNEFYDDSKPSETSIKKSARQPMILTNDKKDEQLRLDENSNVEEPLLEQLAAQGWEVLRLKQVQQPGESMRQHFGQVIIQPKLEEALRRINPFLEDDQVAECVRRITEFNQSTLIENNQYILRLLLENTSVSENRKTGEQSPNVRYVDFKEVKNNSFIAISQFKVRVPGTDNHIVPDITLFLNGLPVSVIEAKSSKVKEPIAEAIDQLRRYSQQRGMTGEGNPELFYYNQFLVATCRAEAKFGTITTQIEKHWFRWTDPYPLTLADLPSKGTSPNDQQRLVAGMLTKRHLLDLIQSFTIFGEDDKGRTIKVVARYQQVRAVKKAIERLLAGRNKQERSGIIWHTQGSGKSLTMMFMVRVMRNLNYFNNWKVVFVTDRTQLEDQLSGTGKSIGQTVKIAEWINPDPKRPNKSLKELLATDTPDLIMAMIQKFQEADLREIFPRLNESPNILVMIDEAHRSQYKLLGANLDRALPNAARIAYTGTPIDKMESTFGEYIDKYTMKQSIEDGTTLVIVYEGRTHNAEIIDKAGMDRRFEDVFSDYNLQERLQILGYGSRDAYLEAKTVIQPKAKDMLWHYVNQVFPNGFKAQVVATSREAAVSYKQYLDTALQEIVAELEQSNPNRINLDLLKTIETAVVISGDRNDSTEVKKYTQDTYHKDAIRRFKLPYDAQEIGGDQTVNGKVGIIVVNNMLLTGFDAPLEQVLYLDRVITDHNLLQAIARVNRVSNDSKDKGFVVDYVGVGSDLKKALDSYAERERNEIIEALDNVTEEINHLVQAHREIMDFLQKYGLTDITDSDAFFDLFYDENIRFEYLLLFQKLTRAFNNVMPRKEALEIWQDYLNFSAVNELAYRHLKDSRISMRGIPPKLRAITDEFLVSKGIEQKIEPISILNPEFEQNVSQRKRDKTKAAEVEHAIRHFIEMNISEDPELFASFAAELEKILAAFAENWKKIYEELEKLRKKMAEKEKETTYGLDRKKHMPIFNFLRAELFDNRPLTEDEIAQAVDLTQNLFNLVETENQFSGFWGSIPSQNRLKAELQALLLSERYLQMPEMFSKYKQTISRIMEWARGNPKVFVR